MFRSKNPSSSKLRGNVSSPTFTNAIFSPIAIDTPNSESGERSYSKAARLSHPKYTKEQYIECLSAFLAFLPKSSLLNLRLASRATYDMVSTVSPLIFSNLYIDFPILSHKSFAHAAGYCTHITITFSPSTQLHKCAAVLGLPPETATLPPLPNLTRLHIISPATDTFHSLLTFHLAIQTAHLPLLTHFSLSNATADSILALRWGAFTSFAYLGLNSSTVWRRLKSLQVSLVPWWTTTTTTTSQPQTRHERDTYRTNVKILHDWLNTFATNGSLSTIHFTWTIPTPPYHAPHNINPLLLDISSTPPSPATTKPWFSAPPIKWPPRLKEIWLSGVHVDRNDVNEMKMRMPGLERLVVRKGGKWFEIRLGERVREEGDGGGKGKGTGKEREGRGRVVGRRDGEMDLDGEEEGEEEDLTVDDIMNRIDLAVRDCLHAEGRI